MKLLTNTLMLAFLGIVVSCSETHDGELKKGENSSELQEHPVVVQLNQLVIPKVEFTETPIEDAFDFANLASMSNDPEADPARKGISFILQLASHVGAADSGLDPLPSAVERKVNYSAKNVRYLDLIAEIASQGRLDAYVTSVGIVVIPEGRSPFPNGKASEGEIWKALRITRQTNGEQVGRGDGDKPSN